MSTALRSAALVPAYDAERTVGSVVGSLCAVWPGAQRRGAVLVIDDGSRDETACKARKAGALVVCHGRNRGKGAALRTGMRVAAELGFDAVVTVDADGQHPANEALRLAQYDASPDALVLGVRDLARAGAPKANRMSNGISNFFLSRFTGRELRDTQCGLRRYPVEPVLALGARSEGYAFEAEILLLALEAGIELVQVPVQVLYDGPIRTTHFHAARDPARIIGRVLLTLGRERIASRPGRGRPSLQG